MPGSDIHPTAIIDPRAELAAGVKVGPWCSITGRVVIGEGTMLHERVTLNGPLVIGRGNVFYPQSVIGLEPQDRKFAPATEGAGVVMGDENIVREGVTIHRATGAHATTLGDRNYLMVNSHVGHDVVIGNTCTFVNGSLVGGHARVGDSVTLGGNACVHQFCRMGRMSMLAGTRGVTQDVPPFCTVYNPRRISSLNLVGLRRAGYRERIENLQEAFDIFFRRGLANDTAVETIERRVGADPLCQEFIDFIRSTKRGITAYGGSEQVEDSDE
ncbi:MAG: acyl-ACP--UDP-N-acetylglucosamine O-acyltransferase [Planctomycetes bacterium]|nr:acyl-ACP--UDP-N-acetylglucosamine O-acyltransferase [Planctomycetota bacterium]